MRDFFNVILVLARSSEPWCFPAGSCFFSKLFYCQQYCQQLQATESRQKGYLFYDFSFFQSCFFTASSCRQLNPSISRISRLDLVSKKTVFLGFQTFWHSLVLQRRHVRELCNVVWCFSAGSCFFSKLFSCQ